MKKIFRGRFQAILFCFVLALAFAGCVSPGPFFEAYALDVIPPPGYARVTRDSLTGRWRSREGAVFDFNNNNFQSSLYNEGKPSAYNIRPVFDSYLLVFIANRHLTSFFVYLSQDLNTLVLDGITYNRVGN